MATKSGWYPEFLMPVVAAIMASSGHKQILDIGTGPGTLPQMLIKRAPDLYISGIDTSTVMIDEAKRGLTHQNVFFQHRKANTSLEFSNNRFDTITFCSVLFLMDDVAKVNLINEALRVLKPGGTLLILTPSGKKSILSSFTEVWKYPFSLNNFTFIIWKIATTKRARLWRKQGWLSQFSIEKKMNYSVQTVFNNNAILETISNKIKFTGNESTN